MAARRARHRAPGLEVRTDLLDGGTAAALARHSARAQLLVVGHRDDVLTRHGWGSTAAYLAHHCECPLLVHRGAVPDRGPVVLAASASESADATVACAYREADRSGARLVAVHVWTRPAGRGREAARDWAAGRDEADRRLAEALAGYAWTWPDVTVERLVLQDLDIAYTLERASQRGRLLVAGMGRNGRFAELLYGSLRLAPRVAACPVLLVPPDRSPARAAAVTAGHVPRVPPERAGRP